MKFEAMNDNHIEDIARIALSEPGVFLLFYRHGAVKENREGYIPGYIKIIREKAFYINSLFQLFLMPL